MCVCVQCVRMEHLSAAQTRFALNLFQKIRDGNASGNVFYSPLSISAALSMLSLGAGGNTASQMTRVSLTSSRTKLYLQQHKEVLSRTDKSLHMLIT